MPPVGAIVGIIFTILAVSVVWGMRWSAAPAITTPGHVGATVGFSRELASVRRAIDNDHAFGEGWEWSAALSGVEADLSRGLNDLLMRVCDQLNIDARERLTLFVHDADMAPVLTAPEPTALARGASHG